MLRKTLEMNLVTPGSCRTLWDRDADILHKPPGKFCLSRDLEGDHVLARTKRRKESGVEKCRRVLDKNKQTKNKFVEILL